METTKVYWGNMGIMEKKMETTTFHPATLSWEAQAPSPKPLNRVVTTGGVPKQPGNRGGVTLKLLEAVDFFLSSRAPDAASLSWGTLG